MAGHEQQPRDSQRPSGDPPGRVDTHGAAAPMRTPATARDVLSLQQMIGNRAVGAVLQRFKGGTLPDAAAPERVSSDVTGRYTTFLGDDGRVTLQLNQAGNHIEGWWQSHAWRAPGQPARLAYWRLQARLVADDGQRATF